MTANVIPRYRELNVNALMNEVKYDIEIMKFLPDPDNQARRLNREFVMRILFAVRGDWMKEIVSKAISQR